MFQFITVSHPDEIKEKRKQEKIRQHAIRCGIKRTKEDKVKRRDNFVPVKIDQRNGQLLKRKMVIDRLAITKAPSSSCVDPFNSLPGCPERMCALMRHKGAKQAGEPIFSITEAGKVFFQGIDTIFRGAFTDPALFHSLSLVLALAANENVSNVECLMHRGETLRNLSDRVGNPEWVPQVSTLTAMLLIIGYEYRVDGATSGSIDMHVRAVDEVLKVSRAANIKISDAIHRALFWQDLYSCLFVSTSRLLSHGDYPEISSERDPGRFLAYVIPSGFRSVINTFPMEFAVVLEDLNALCSLLDTRCGPRSLPTNDFSIDNGQAWIESRLVELLDESRHWKYEDPVYEACIFASFLCTYKLATGIWEGCFIPEFCATQVLDLISRANNDPRWERSPELLLWLLLVTGALAERKRVRIRATMMLMQTTYRQPLKALQQDWERLQGILRTFVWSELAMEDKFLCFWKELHPVHRNTSKTELSSTVA